MARKRKAKRSAWGSVIYRADRGWYAVRVPVDGENDPGKRTSYRVYPMPSKQAAEDKLKELRGLHDAGRLVVRAKDAPDAGAAPGEVLTVLGAIDAYIKVKEAEGKTAKTLEGYRSLRRPFIEHPLGAVPVDQVRPEDVEAFLAWRRETVFHALRTPGSRRTGPSAVRPREGATASNGTVNRTLSILSGALSRLVRLRKLAENPVARVQKPDEGTVARVALGKEDVLHLIAAADEFFRPLLVAALFTGARRGELVNLVWSDLDLDVGTILLRRPKVKNWTRMEIHPVLLEELKALRRRRGVPGPEEPVFLTRAGHPFKDPRYPWKKAVSAAGLGGREGLKFHSCRHTFAVHFLEHGAAVTDLQAVLGHSNLSTTQVYAKMVDHRMNASIRALDYGSVPAGRIAGDLRTRERTQEGEAGEGDKGSAAVTRVGKVG